MQSKAKTVEQYLAALPDDRRTAIDEVRDVILANLPEGVRETMNWGMICYEIPLEICPETYNGQPLMFAALASQKRHMAVYLTSIYTHDGQRTAFEDAYRATGKRMDMGKSCVRFRTLEDLPLPLIGEAIGRMSVDEFVAMVNEVNPPKKRRKKRA